MQEEELWRKLDQAGFTVEEAKDLKPKLFKFLPDGFTDYHKFFDFAASLQIIARRNSSSIADARKYVQSKDGFCALFNIHGLSFVELPENARMTFVTPKPPADDRQAGRKPFLLDIDDMVLSIRTTLEITGRDIDFDDIIEYGPCAGEDMKWRSANERLKGYNKRHPGCGFYSINTLMEKYGIEKPPPGNRREKSNPPPKNTDVKNVKEESGEVSGAVARKGPKTITAARIYASIKSAIAQGDDISRLTDKRARVGELTLGRIVNAFAKAALADLGDYIPPGHARPSSLQDFAFASGLVRAANRKSPPPPVQPPQRKI